MTSRARHRSIFAYLDDLLRQPGTLIGRGGASSRGDAPLVALGKAIEARVRSWYEALASAAA